MINEEVKQKEERLAEMYLAYYRLLMKMPEQYRKLEKMKIDIDNLAGEIEHNYFALVDEKEKENGEELC